MKYVLFVKTSCPFCVRAQEILEEQNLEFNLINFEEDQRSILEEIKAAYEWPTVPMIFQVKDDAVIKFIGGFTDLENHLDE